MLRFVILAVLLSLSGMASAQSSKTNEEIWALASYVDTITKERRQLGIDWAETHERALSNRYHRPYSCVYVDVTVVDAGGETFKGALCMPQTCRALPPEETIVFYTNLAVTRSENWATVVFTTDRSMRSRCDRAYHRSQRTKKIVVQW